MELIVGNRNPHTVATVKCAGCGTMKLLVNHWFVCSVIDDMFLCEPLGDKLWSLDNDEMPVCGASCAQKKFQQYLSVPK